MLYKPTYANPHLIAYDVPIDKDTGLPRLTLEFDVSGNNCIGYKVYIKNIKDDVWTDLNTEEQDETSNITVTFKEKATPVAKQTENQVYGVATKNNDKIFVLNTVANNGDRIVFDALIEGYTFATNETYQWKVQLYDDSYLNAEGQNIYKEAIATDSIIKERRNGEDVYKIDIRKLENAQLGMSVRQWVLGDNNTYNPITGKITGIQTNRSSGRVYAYVDCVLETDKTKWMPCSPNRNYTPIDILQSRTVNTEYSFVGYGVVQGVTDSKITVQKHYNVRENMMLFLRDNNAGNYGGYIMIQSPEIDEVNQNMTIIVTDATGITKGQYYKIYSYFVESDAYTFEYNESPVVDFKPSANEEETVADKPYLNVKFPCETFIGTYNHPTEEVVSYNFEVKCEEKTVAKSGEIYSANINFTVDGLINGKTYRVIMSVVDTKNRTIVKEKLYTVKYIGEVLSRDVSEVKATYVNHKFCVLLENCFYALNDGRLKRREQMVLYRLSPNSLLMEKVIEQSFDENDAQNVVNVVADYKIGNEADYQYVAFSDTQVYNEGFVSLFDENDPSQEAWEENGESWISECYIRSSPIVHIDCDSYVVMELALIGENRYRPKTLWTFELNIEEGNMVQNLSKEQYLTLSRFPKISKAKRDYITSSLSCYIGGIDMYEDYIDNKSLMDKWAEFVSSDSKKVLKDTKGNLYEIEILNPQYKNNLTAFRLDKHGHRQSPTTIQFDWVQVGDMDKEAISISGHARTIGELDGTIEGLDRFTIGELDNKPIFDVAYAWEFGDAPIPENTSEKQYQ